MTDQWLWNCPNGQFLVALAQGWSMSLCNGEPSFIGTGHGRFAVLMYRNAEGRQP